MENRFYMESLIITSYQNFIGTKAKQYIDNGIKFTCEDFVLETIVQYSFQRRLPFWFKTGSQTFNSTSEKYRNVYEFKSRLLSRAGANDLANNKNTIRVAPEIPNGSLKLLKEAQVGDIILLDQNNDDVYDHAQLVTGVTDKNVFVAQGNTQRGICYTIWDSSDPDDKSCYVGKPVASFHHELSSGKYSRDSVLLFKKASATLRRWNIGNLRREFKDLKVGYKKY